MKKIIKALFIVFISVLIIVLSSFSSLALLTTGFNANFSSDILSETINFYSPNKDILYSVESSIRLKSFVTNDYEYTMYNLSPYGYAIIYDKTGALVEAGYTSDSLPPYSFSRTKIFYYAGPFNYFVLSSDGPQDLISGSKLNSSSKTLLANLERNVQTLSCSISLTSQKDDVQSLTLNSNSSEDYFIAVNYFTNLINYGKNENGTCTVIAASMLFGYFDQFVDDSFVPSQYEEGSGTNEAFHQLLNDYVYGSSPEGGIFIHDAQEGFNDYLSSRPITARLLSEHSSNSSARTKIISELADGRPVIASMGENLGANWNHTALIYGVSYDPSNMLGTAVVQFHNGWNKNKPEMRAFYSSINWFYECGYMSCVEGHSFGRWTGNAYGHSSVCSCGEREEEPHGEFWDSLRNRCIRCGYSGPIQGSIFSIN